MGALDWVQVQYVTDGEADPDQFNAEVADNLNNAPRGIVAYGVGVSSQSISGGGTDLTNLTKTFTAVAGRLYRITLFSKFDGCTETDGVFLQIRKGASTNIAELKLLGGHPSTANDVGATLVAIDEPGAGSVTYKGWAQASGGTHSTAGSNHYIIIDDIGPA